MNLSAEHKDIIDTLVGLHRWREEYNGDDIGFGADELFGNETEKRHFAHAYAVWGTGYVNLYRITGDSRYLAAAKRCSHWLQQNRNQKYMNASWGLPLDWQGAEQQLSYCITTLYCADLFYELFLMSRDTEYSDMLMSIRRWLLEENRYVCDLQRTRGIWFRYANSSRFPRVVLNTTAKAAGFFGKMFSMRTENSREDAYFASSCARFILKNQLRCGCWFYNDNLRRPKIDLIHSALVIEGLRDFSDNTGFFRKEVDRAISQGVKFLCQHMVRRSGIALEQYPVILTEPFKLIFHGTALTSLLTGLIYGIITETRSYGYAMLLKAACDLNSSLNNITNKCRLAAGQLIRRCRKKNGAFSFRPRNTIEYIRVQAHIFDGMSKYLLKTGNR